MRISDWSSDVCSSDLPSRTISLNHCCFWHPTRHMRCMALAMPIMASPRVEEPAQIPGRKTKKEQVHITDKMRGRPMKGLKTLAALGMAGIACASAQEQDAGLRSEEHTLNSSH